jgi:hypothetical protein
MGISTWCVLCTWCIYKDNLCGLWFSNWCTVFAVVLDTSARSWAIKVHFEAEILSHPLLVSLNQACLYNEAYITLVHGLILCDFDNICVGFFILQQADYSCG